MWILGLKGLREGRPRTRYIRTLLEATGFATFGELRTAMLDQSDLRGRIHVVRASARPLLVMNR